MLDNILGGLTGGGQGQSSFPGSSSSPLTKALLMLLAAKAYQHYTSRPSQPGLGGQTGGGQIGGGFDPASGGMAPNAAPSGGLGDMLRGGAGGGLLGGLAGGGLGGLLGGLVSGGGLNSILDQLRNSGHGDVANSWVGTGQNQPIHPDQLRQALGPDTVDELAQKSGMSNDDVLRELSEQLPAAVDQFTPDGRIPTQEDVNSRWV
ncbi:YidB family protein [Alsobacter metallidurans]|uniref:YidB family protein n=1 Tax=Alsobacter metallidurans TaxID=340221 RepID=UPI003FCEC755